MYVHGYGNDDFVEPTLEEEFAGRMDAADRAAIAEHNAAVDRGRANWWELPHGTVVRDAKGALRMVHQTSKSDVNRPPTGPDDIASVWLLHWSDEYAPYVDRRSPPKEPEDSEDANWLPVTIVKIDAEAI